MKNKALLGIFLAAALVIAQVVAAEAASNGQTVTPPTDTSTPVVSPTPTSAPCSPSSTSGSGTPTAGDTGSVQPVAEALCNYFNPILGVSYSDILSLNQSGFGYGLIAQACWMAEQLNSMGTGTTYTCQQILQDKQSGQISSLGLTGVSNWGQLIKSVLGHQHNLGQIMSGHANATPGSHGGKPSWAGGGGH